MQLKLREMETRIKLLEAEVRRQGRFGAVCQARNSGENAADGR